MGHEADRTFFDNKRPWSKRKDQILGYYLKPYLAKVSTLGKPMVLVDAFAGPGRFGDGEMGSPLIIASAIQSFLNEHPRVACTQICIERDPSLHSQLAVNLKPFSFARAENCAFLDYMPRLEALARTSSMFIYADPFAIAGLQWDAMDRVFGMIDQQQSIELLLNFNSAAFVRRARSALQYAVARGDSDDDDDASGDVATTALNGVVGGDWWKNEVTPDGWFIGEVEGVAEKLRQKLRSRFGEAGMYPIREKLGATLPKYYLIFATRHPDGLVLVNGAACRDREGEVAKIRSAQRLFFETSPEELPSVPQLLRPALMKLLRDGMRRRALLEAVIRENFGLFTDGTINEEIKLMRTERRIRAEPDAQRLNDDSRLFLTHR